LCLSATDDGKLASGGRELVIPRTNPDCSPEVGIDGIRLWDLSTMKPLEGPVGVGHRGATTALVWIRRDVELDHGLIYGTQNGFLICWKEKKAEDAQVFEEVHCGIVANPGEITGLAFASSSSQLAVCNRNSVVQLFAIDANMKPRVVFSVTIDDYVPKAIAFKQSAGERREILTFGLHDGRM
jgi:WD40 repeat protein